MAVQEEIAELLVQVRADVKELKAGLNAAQKETKDFAKDAGDAVTTLAKKFAVLFSINEIRKFVSESAKAFGEQQRSLALLGEAVKRNGGDWEKLRKSAKDYIDQAESNTRFQDTEISASLTMLTQKTKSLSTAMALNNLAMDMAAGTGKNLAETSQTLSLAYAGNQRGIMQLARELGITGVKAKDAAFLLAEVERRFGGIAKNQDDLLTIQQKLGKEFENLGKDLIGAFEPAIRGVLELAKDFVIASREAVVWWRELLGLVNEDSSKGAIQKEINSINERIQRTEANRQINLRLYREATGQAKDFHLTKIALDDAHIKSDQKRVEELEKLLKKEVTDVKAAEQAKVRAGAKSNQERLKAEEDAEKERERLAKDRLDRIQKMGKAIAQAMYEAFSATFATMFEELKKGTLTAAAAFEALGKSIFKAIVKALAGVLQQLGAKEFVEAVASAVAEDYYGAAKHAAAGALYEAGAAAMSSAADAYLAEGGIATGPTRAMIGEGGEPEMVVPLSKSREMGFGGGGLSVDGGIHINLPNVKNPQDFASPSTAQSVSRMLLKTLDDMNRRSGQRLATI